MNLMEMLRDTDALTYVNSLKVTLTEVKQLAGDMKEMRDNWVNACDNMDKLIRKADNQYRLIAKIAQNRGSIVSELTIRDELSEPSEELRQLMEEG